MFFPRLLLYIKIIIILYYLDFSNNREKIYGASSNSENNKNAVARDEPI